jgi:hypothetical protein
MESAQEVPGTDLTGEPEAVMDLADIPSIIAAASDAVAHFVYTHSLSSEGEW